MQPINSDCGPVLDGEEGVAFWVCVVNGGPRLKPVSVNSAVPVVLLSSPAPIPVILPFALDATEVVATVPPLPTPTNADSPFEVEDTKFCVITLPVITVSATFRAIVTVEPEVVVIVSVDAVVIVSILGIGGVYVEIEVEVEVTVVVVMVVLVLGVDELTIAVNVIVMSE